MLANLTSYPPVITLIQDSNIQFLDFGFTPEIHPQQGRFVRKTANGPLLRLDYDTERQKYVLPSADGSAPEVVEPEITILSERSLTMLDGHWLPLPILRDSLYQNDSRGPDNWARFQIIKLKQPDTAGNTCRLTIALDTKVYSDHSEMKLLAPCVEDVINGTLFSLAWRDEELDEFIDQTWIDGWLREIFIRFASEQEDRLENEINLALRKFEYQAHWLNLLTLLGNQLTIPRIKIISDTPQIPVIPVDLVLDIGNSHTCGVITEEHRGETNGLRQTTELQIRSLSKPQYINAPLFTSRLEFSKACFGKQHFSVESGRDDAFVWPSITRIGEEALTLAIQRQGTDGTTGLSSPRRYLWDETSWLAGWRFSQQADRHGNEPMAIAPPLMNLINDEGEPLYLLPADERLPVFSAYYSRSSLMTHMLCELLAQALTQINSVDNRIRLGNSQTPRQLRSLILTLPTAMPQQERIIFRQRMYEAIALVWKIMGWHPLDADFTADTPQAFNSKVPIPLVQMDWDEASCGQIFWLYNELQVNYAGQADALFNGLSRADMNVPGKQAGILRIASIDIGGGTTDMVVNRYQLDNHPASHNKIMPYLLFREGFKVAGDDILLDIIQQYILPALQNQITQAGVTDSSTLMNTLFGNGGRTDNQNALRQQATLQLLIPLACAISEAWEQSDPADPMAGIYARIADLLPAMPGNQVLHYVQQAVQQALPVGAPPFDLLQTPLQICFDRLRRGIVAGEFAISAPLHALCEAISHYRCDILLLTGRPTNLPGIQALLHYLQPVPVTCMVKLGDYQVHEWYPFSQQGHISQPKSTAATGAMLLKLAQNLRLPGFNLSTASIHAYSTIRYLGVLDEHNLLPDSQVWYHNISPEQPHSLPDSRLSFPLRDDVRLGFRQLDNERWPATPLYTLSIRDDRLKKALAVEGELYISLRLKADIRSGNTDMFELAEARFQSGKQIPLEQLSLKLNTLNDPHSNIDQYWIDSGSVYQK